MMDEVKVIPLWEEFKTVYPAGFTPLIRSRVLRQLWGMAGRIDPSKRSRRVLHPLSSMAEKKINILVVDDELGILDIFSRMLKAKGYKVDIARNGYEAGKKAKQMSRIREAYQIAFIDVVMPGLNGPETLRVIKKYFPRIAAVMMTGYAVDDIVKETLKLKARTCIKKPFKIQEILDTISKIREENLN